MPCLTGHNKVYDELGLNKARRLPRVRWAWANYSYSLIRPLTRYKIPAAAWSPQQLLRPVLATWPRKSFTECMYLPANPVCHLDGGKINQLILFFIKPHSLTCAGLTKSIPRKIKLATTTASASASGSRQRTSNKPQEFVDNLFGPLKRLKGQKAKWNEN